MPVVAASGLEYIVVATGQVAEREEGPYKAATKVVIAAVSSEVDLVLLL